jgi:Uncharacterised protein family (UPF0236)
MQPREEAPQQSSHVSKGRKAQAEEILSSVLDELDHLALEEAGGRIEEDDLGGMEFAYRDAALKLASMGLARRMKQNRGMRGSQIDCGQGHKARFVGYRERTLWTAVGAIRWDPAYYHCKQCLEGDGGRFPRDDELGITKESESPGLRKIVARVSSKGPFVEAREDLRELCGLQLPVKRVERSGEASGELLRIFMEQEWDQVRRHHPPAKAKGVPKMYVALDGTGCPMVPKETEGRQGKDKEGRARTREVKIGCVFTQTTEGKDKEGNPIPIRDPDSTTLVASFEAAARFGELLQGEALRRGWEQAETKVVIGDGAEWIWNLADQHFEDAIQIVDLYHAKEKLSGLSKLLFPSKPEQDEWKKVAYEELDAGDIPSLLEHCRAPCLSRSRATNEELERTTGYFERNQERMKYREFREAGLFVGSGVVEAGCKTCVAARLKQAGMRWTVRGAGAIVSLRAARPRWKELWEKAHEFHTNSSNLR